MTSRPSNNQQIDFEGLASLLLRDITMLLPQWLPGGKTLGREYCVGNLRGESGQSLRVNLETGKWADFADDKKGGDLISLYGAIHGISNKDAALELLNVSKTLTKKKSLVKNRETRKKINQDIIIPIKDGQELPSFEFYDPNGVHTGLKPSGVWEYRIQTGQRLFFVARYDIPNEKKQFRPWVFTEFGRWKNKYPQEPRPLYRLPELLLNKKRPVLVVEGEKSADAAYKLLGKVYDVTTWPCGGNSWNLVDWSPVYGRKVLLWPDSDTPGIDTGKRIAQFLSINGCQVKVLDVKANGGWDAADALYEGFDYSKTIEWAKPLAKVYDPSLEPKTPEIVDKKNDGPADDDENIDVDSTDQYEDLTEDKVLQHQKEPIKKTTRASTVIYEADEFYNLDQLYTNSGVDRNTKGLPYSNAANCTRILNYLKSFRGLIRYDKFTTKIVTNFDGKGWQPYSDKTFYMIFDFFQHYAGFYTLAKHVLQDAIQAVALHNEIDLAMEWITSLKWDGTSRIDYFLRDYCGVEFDEYSMLVSKNLFLSIAARITKPGCKVDSMVILEGVQGVRKSTLLQVLAGDEWFGELSGEIGRGASSDKDIFMNIQGKLIVEISELESFVKSSNQSLKRFFTTRSDEFRKPYGIETQKFPRRCVFVGTTNEDEYLNDATGNRRYWPVKVQASTIEIEKVRDIREQLFAEALARLNSGEGWFDMESESAQMIQQSRLELDPIINDVLSALSKVEYLRSGLTVDEIISNMGLSVDKKTVAFRRRVGKILRSLGFDSRPERTTLNGKSMVKKVFRFTKDEADLRAKMALPLHQSFSYID